MTEMESRKSEEETRRHGECKSNLLFPLCLCGLILFCGAGCAPDRVRFAAFNASLNRDKPGQLLQDLAKGNDPQIRNVAEIIQRTRPDVLLINEFDFDESDRAFGLFVKNYLEKSQNGAEPISYRYHFVAPVNTGIHSGHDLDNNGKVVSEIGSRDYGGDAMGFGLFSGQYGMMILSRYPIDRKNVRTFQRLKWKDMPGALLPTNADGSPWYDEAELNVLRLSSKSHWDVPVKIGSKTVHVLASHPTPPAFDGLEDRNGKRNHDEIRLWADYLHPLDPTFRYLHDDTNREVSGDFSQPFVVLGDLNADPHDGGSVQGAVQQLLDHPLINSSLVPASTGAAEAANQQGGKNAEHRSPAYEDTADFPDTGTNGPGNLRCDYVLPSKTGIAVLEGGVFWPGHDDPLYRLVNMEPTAASSDHRLVWVDVRVK